MVVEHVVVYLSERKILNRTKEKHTFVIVGCYRGRAVVVLWALSLAATGSRPFRCCWVLSWWYGDDVVDACVWCPL